MYHNPFSVGYQVLSSSGYSLDTYNNVGSASYRITSTIPDYVGMFYSPSEHEVMTSIKYGNFDQGYDNLREVQESLNGPPMEFYIPSSMAVADGVGRQDTQILPDKIGSSLIERANKEIIQEIKKAQNQITGKIKRIEYEDLLIIRKRKRTVIFDDAKENQRYLEIHK